MLKIYNSLSRSKEVFKPITPGKVNFYVCGMTVYDFCHIGHARAMLAFDVVIRYLRFSGYQVKFVRNITDIDDKIIRRANENHEDYTELTDRFVLAMHEDFDALGLLHPEEEPRATQFIAQIIHIIQTLVDKGYAYIGGDGDVYYDVRRFKNYGVLSHRNLEQLHAGARIKVAEAKHDPLDFVLWKAAKAGEPSWDSPWGKGRPGWHIECSAMATECLAKHIDIHAGGKDLIFPHHENEIAQSEAYTGEPFANYWMHAGHLEINKAKMSKSLGNFFTIREVLEQYPAEVIRYFMIASHYRSPLNYSEASFAEATQSLSRLYLTLREGSGEYEKGSDYESAFNEAMNDDFNTPKALAVLFDLAKEINRTRTESAERAKQLAGILKYLGNVLGLLHEDPDVFLKDQKESESVVDIQHVESLIKERNLVRENKDWKRADQLRDELEALGIILEDGSEGTLWRRK